MNIKRIGMYFIAAAMTASMMPSVSAATQNPTYSQQYVEDFESNNIDTVLGEGGILSLKKAEQSEKVTIKENAKTKNNYLSIESDGNNDNGCLDVQVKMNPGLLTNDVTVVDMKVSTTNVSNNNFPAIMILDGNSKIGNGNSAFWFNNSGVPVLADITPGATAKSSTYLGYYSDETWYDLKIVLDRTNNTVTTSMCGTNVSKTSTMTSAWSDDITLSFQSALGETFNIDDIVISDGFYKSNHMISHDFNNVVSETFEKANIRNYFPGLKSNVDLTAGYDTETENSYVVLPPNDTSNAALFTEELIEIGTEGPVVVEYSLKTDATSNITATLRKTDSSRMSLFQIKNGIINPESSNPIDVSDGNFHTYRVTMYASADKVYISKLVDGAWIGTTTRTVDKAGTYRCDITIDDTVTSVGVDDYRVYYPGAPDLRIDIAGRNDVSKDESIILVSNMPMNYSTPKKVQVMANGEPVEFVSKAIKEENAVRITPIGGLQPNTTYTINTNTMKDMFDQEYKKEFTFSTTTWVVPINSDFSYTIDGETIEKGKFRTGTMAAVTTVKANTAAGATVNTYVAQYNVYNELIDLAVIPVAIAQEGQISENAEINIYGDTETIKVMTWENNQNAVSWAQTLTKEIIK